MIEKLVVIARDNKEYGLFSDDTKWHFGNIHCKEYAEYIVKCVNEHESLVEELEKLNQDKDNLYGDIFDYNNAGAELQQEVYRLKERAEKAEDEVQKLKLYNEVCLEAGIQGFKLYEEKNEQLKVELELKKEHVEQCVNNISKLKAEIEKLREMLKKCNPFDNLMSCKFCHNIHYNSHSDDCEYMIMIGGQG